MTRCHFLPGSHFFQMSGFWSTQRLAASSADSLCEAIISETLFWSSFVHLKFFRNVAASPPVLVNSVLKYFWRGVDG